MVSGSQTATAQFSAGFLFTAAIGAPLIHPLDATSAVTACPTETTLEELTSCLIDSNHMPRSGANGFIAPSPSEQADWDRAVTDMLSIGSSSCVSAGPDK